MKKLIRITFVLLLFANIASAKVLWTENGVKITHYTGGSFDDPVSDGNGGVIIAYEDFYSGGLMANVCMQRIDQNGVIKWNSNGIRICPNDNQQYWNCVASDGSGGALIAWQENERNGAGTNDVFLQRVDSSGQTQWASTGVSVCTIDHHQGPPKIINDNGNAIVVWGDSRSGSAGVYVQKFNSSGVAQWTAGGVRAIPLASVGGNVYGITSDGAGGVLVGWNDPTDKKIYVQKVDITGVIQWISGGIIPCNNGNDKQPSSIMSDGSGGAIISWADNRAGNYSVYAQRVNANGVVQWTTDGVIICNASENQYSPRIAYVGNNKYVVVWLDARNGSEFYAQKIGIDGVVEWVADGVKVCNTSNIYAYPYLVYDGIGGTIVIWEDTRNGSYNQVYAQKISSTGLTLWQENGILIANVTSAQTSPAIINDGFGGAIINFITASGIYVQRIDNATNTNISYQNNSTVNLADAKGRQIKLDIPALTFNKDIVLNFNPEPVFTTCTQTGTKSVGIGIEITVSESVALQKPISLALSYLDADITSIDENKLVLATFNTTTSKWDILPSTVDAINNKITARISHLSLFQIMEYTPPANLDTLKVYPNPFKPNIQAGITFSGLTSNATAAIYTLSGEKVAEVVNGLWDGKNSAGSLVSSGVYLGLVSDGIVKKTIKIAIER